MHEVIHNSIFSLDHFIGHIFENQTLAVFCSCFVIGFVLKMMKSIDNRHIPLSIVGWGTLMMVVVDNHVVAGQPFIVEKLIAASAGMTIGFAAWFTHCYLWKPILKKVLSHPALAKFVESDESNDR